MKMTGLVAAMILGAAAGAIVATMLPKQSAAHKMVQKAADAVEDAAMNVGEKLSNKLDAM